MGKEKEKDKDKKDKDKKDKDKKDKDKKDKEKKEKDKKDKEKKDKDKKEKKEKESGDTAWKIKASSDLDSYIISFETITNKFRDIDNYILKEAKSKENFIEKVQELISELPEASQNVFKAFLDSI